MIPVRVAAPLPDPNLPLADWADRYEIALAHGKLTPMEAARRAFDRAPGWVRMLLALRNRIVAPLGLKTGPATGVPIVGFFPIVSNDDREVALGFDDWHLDFRVLVDVRSYGSNGQVIGVTTLVHRKNLFGRIYIAVVTPFHRAIVPVFLARLGRGQKAVN